MKASSRRVDSPPWFPVSGAEGEGEPAPLPVPRRRLDPQGWGDSLANVRPNSHVGASKAMLLDSREVAELLGLGRTKVFQMMARSELPVIRLGRCVRVPRAALEEWVRGRTGKAVPQQRAVIGPDLGWGQGGD